MYEPIFYPPDGGWAAGYLPAAQPSYTPDLPEGYSQWLINGETLLMNGQTVISED